MDVDIAELSTGLLAAEDVGFVADDSDGVMCACQGRSKEGWWVSQPASPAVQQGYRIRRDQVAMLTAILEVEMC